ncbi:MAG: hypothetical protein AB1458_04595 [Bacteroidota bacterium]
MTAVLFFSGCRKNDRNLFHRLDPEDFLSGKKYEKLLVEVNYVSGFEPSAGALAELRDFLEQRLNKPDGITVISSSIPSPGQSFYSIADLKEIEDRNRMHYSGRGTLTTYVLFVDGGFSGNSGNAQVLGAAYDPTSICIFQKTVKDFSGGPLQPSRDTLEAVVLEHEFGHLMGLVNHGTAMQVPHQDGANGHHCSNQNCLMYYNVETTDIISVLLGGYVPSLDTECINDLRANGGK